MAREAGLVTMDPVTSLGDFEEYVCTIAAAGRCGGLWSDKAVDFAVAQPLRAWIVS
jgi:hypothetical protein